MHGRQIQKYQNEKSFHSPDVTTVTSVLGILKNTRAQQFISLSMHHNYLEGIRKQLDFSPRDSTLVGPSGPQ